MSNLTSPKRHAFTLVELLVVIGIIALLISILLPTLGRARETANRAACMSNLRQLATAVLIYEQQFKSLPGRALPAYIDPEIAAAETGITDTERSNQLALNVAFAKILGNSGVKFDPVTGKPTAASMGSAKSVWYCPSSTAIRESATPASSSTIAGKVLGYGYRINNQKSTRAPCFFGSHDNTTYNPATLAGTSDEQKRPKKLVEVRGAYCQAGLDKMVSDGDIVKDGVTYKRYQAQMRLTTSEIWMFSDIDGRCFSTATSGKFGISPDTGQYKEYKDRLWQPPHKSGKIGRCYSFFDGHADWRRVEDGDLPPNS